MLLFASMPASAQDYDHEYTAIEVEVNKLLDQGCRQIGITRKARYSTSDGTILARILNVGCTGWPTEPEPPEPVAEAESKQVRITWSHPTQRTDGSPLPASEIDRYVLYVDGEWADVDPYPTQEFIVELSPGTHVITMTTKDSRNVESPFSEPVMVIIE